MTRQINIRILGSGTCVPSLERSACSVLIQGSSQNLLVDAGPGTMHRLLQSGLKINQVDGILLSHFHLDHCSELAPFLFATKYPNLSREKKLHIIGGAGIRRLYENINTAYDHTLDLPEGVVCMTELDEGGSPITHFNDFQIFYTRVNHKPESRAYRFQNSEGFSVVYSGDTDYSDNLIQLSRDADILICESALPDELKAPGHLTPSLAGEIASKANVKKLVLTHFYPECDDVDIEQQCRKSYSGEVILARDLMKIE